MPLDETDWACSDLGTWLWVMEREGRAMDRKFPRIEVRIEEDEENGKERV